LRAVLPAHVDPSAEAGWDSGAPVRGTSLWWRRSLLPILALLVLVGIADAFAAATPLGLFVPDDAHGPATDAPWSDLAGTLGSGERYIRVQLDHDELTVHYDIRLPADSPLIMPLEAGRGADRPDELVGRLFGEVRVLQWPLAFSTGPGSDYDVVGLSEPVVHLPPEHGMVRVQIDSTPYAVFMPQIKLWFMKPWEQQQQEHPFAKDQIIVTGSKGVFVSLESAERITSVVAQQDDKRAVLDRTKAADPYFPIELHSGRRPTLLATVWAAGQTIIPGVGLALWRGVTGVLPLLLLLLLIRLDRTVAGLPAARASLPLLRMLLIVAAGTAVLGLVVDLSFLVHIHQEAASSAVLGTRGAFWYGSGAYGVVVAALLVLWWATLPGWSQPDRVEQAKEWSHSRRLVFAATCIVWSAAVALSWWLLMRYHIQFLTLPVVGSASRAAVAAVAAAAAVAFSATGVLVRRALRTSGAGVVTGLTALCGTTVLAVAVLSPWLLAAEERQLNVAARAVSVLLGASLIAGYVAVAVRWFRHLLGGRNGSVAKYCGLATAAIVFLATLPWLASHTLDRRPNAAGMWSVFPLADALQSISYLLAATCLFFLLREAARLPRGERRVRVKRRLLVVFAVLNFYWFSDLWLFLPVEPLVGAALAVWVALPFDRAAAVSKAATERAVAPDGEEADGNGGSGRGWVQRIRGAVVQTLDGLSRRPGRQSPAPPEPVEDRGVVAARAADATLASEEREDHSWSDGVRSAALGALVGIPWALVYLNSLRTAPASAGDYPVLDAIGFQLLILVQWPMYGFFYGYAFPLLRGSNTIVKALIVVVLAVVPLSLTTLIVWRPDDVRSSAFFALQMLAFGLMLAVAFEISILRRDARLGWHEIVGRHQLRGIVSWASSLAVAVGAAVTTALSSGVGGLIADLFTQIKTGGPGNGPSTGQ
jgi:hypothetical protein